MRTVNSIIQHLVVSRAARQEDVMRTLWQSPAKLIIISSMDNPAVAEYLREICKATARISHFRIMRPGRMDDTCSTFVAAVAADSSMGGQVPSPTDATRHS